VNAPRLPDSESLYVKILLRAYLDLPITSGRARNADRVLARTLFAQQVPLDLVRAAFVLASARRACRLPDAIPLTTVRSLHYFLPVIQELRLSPPDPDYIRHLSARLRPLCP
jgi:hypothetical protein